MEQFDKKSILEMSMGAILERVDYEMGRVLENVLDPNTKATTATSTRTVIWSASSLTSTGPPASPSPAWTAS